MEISRLKPALRDYARGFALIARTACLTSIVRVCFETLLKTTINDTKGREHLSCSTPFPEFTTFFFSQADVSTTREETRVRNFRHVALPHQNKDETSLTRFVRTKLISRARNEIYCYDTVSLLGNRVRQRKRLRGKLFRSFLFFFKFLFFFIIYQFTFIVVEPIFHDFVQIARASNSTARRIWSHLSIVRRVSCRINTKVVHENIWIYFIGDFYVFCCVCYWRKRYNETWLFWLHWERLKEI